MITHDSWKRIKEIFHSAQELELAERSDFLNEACGDDSSIREEVEALLTADASNEDFLSAPAYEFAAGILAGEEREFSSGQKIGRYTILCPLGAGGMGQIYLAEDTELPRKIALKLISPQFANDARRVHRFEQEARAASALNHPNICVIHEIGTTENGRHFIAMEFIQGITLRDQLSRGALSVRKALNIAIQVATALATAHASGIIHRDIKPENIMLRPDGYVKVLDFGLAKLTSMFGRTAPADSAVATMKAQTEPGTVMGTVNYMSPEQARGQAVDARTDVFSLGVVMYEMAAGRMAFAGETAVDTLVSILEKEPPPLEECAPDVPAEFRRMVGKALSKDREERYRTVRDLLDDLKGLKAELDFAQRLERSNPPQADHEASAAQAPVGEAATLMRLAGAGEMAATAGRTGRTKRAGGRRALTFALAAVVVLAALAAGAAALWPRRGASPVATAPASAPPGPAAERAVGYWITVQKYRGGRPYQEPFRLRDDINFEKDYRIRLHVASPQSGRLYLLNEGPAAGGDQTPTFHVLFPSETANNGSALLRENQQIQIPEQSWFQFDGQRGTEKIWLVWAEADVPELEAVKGFANRRDRGAVGSPALRAAVNAFLKARSTPAPTVERDEEKKDTLVRANGE